MQAQNRAVLSRVRRRKAPGVVRLKTLRRMRSILDWTFLVSLLSSSLSLSVFCPECSLFFDASVLLDSGDSAGRRSRAGAYKFAYAEKFSSFPQPHSRPSLDDERKDKVEARAMHNAAVPGPDES